MTPFILGYEIPAGTAAFDPSRGAGPQAEGVVRAKIVEVKRADKPNVVQAEITFEVVDGPRKGESFRGWFNVVPKKGAKAGLASICTGNVTAMIGAVSAKAVTTDNKLVKPLPKDFDIAKTFTGKVATLYTRPAEGNKREQVDFITGHDVVRVESGEKVWPDTRQEKVARRSARGAPRTETVDDVFGDDDVFDAAATAATTTTTATAVDDDDDVFGV